MKQMKRLIMMFMATTILAACSTDGTEPEGFIEPANDSPEFPDGTGFFYRSNQIEETETDGITIRKNSFGVILVISFDGNINAAPTSAKDFFSQYLGLDIETDFRLKESSELPNSMKYEMYEQRYKGILVYDKQYGVLTTNGKVTECNGNYLKIKDLDVTPAFSEQKAKEIFAKYKNMPVKDINAGASSALCPEALTIMEFPVSKNSSKWAPRLVYVVSYEDTNSQKIGVIDAHTGHILSIYNNVYVVIDLY